jgi:hypothetical protein
MHDPLTVAFEIKYPWRQKPSEFWPKGYRNTFITIWHKDPEKDGTDDSCGWFMRARHGNPETLEKINKRFESDWDCEHGGLFFSDGAAQFSTYGTVMNLFWMAAFIHYGDRRRAFRFVQSNLAEILLFAENPLDSLHDGIVGRFGFEKRDERIRSMAGCIYSWILRAERPWYKSPRWHVWHWRVQIHPLQALVRRFFTKCARCHRRGFKKGQSAVSNWGGTEIWHSDCEKPDVQYANPSVEDPRNP